MRTGFSRRTFTAIPAARSAWSTGPSPPRLPKEEQEIFDKLQAESTGAFSTPRTAPDVTVKQAQSEAEDSLLNARSSKSDTDKMLEQLRERARLVAKGDGEELHPNVRRGAAPEFEGDTNPKTGEVGGPKNEPPKSCRQNRIAMAGQPPPYSDHHAGYFKYATPVAEQLSMGPNFQNNFEHRHEAYIFSPEQSNGSSPDALDKAASALYIPSTSPATSEVSLTHFVSSRSVPGQHLKLVKGYEDRGFISLPSGAFDEHSITRTLQHYIHPHFQQDMDPKVSTATSSSESSDSRVPKAHLHKIDISAESASFFDHPAPATSCYMFKWSKPNSVYGGPLGLSGAWEEDLAEVLEHASWKAGKDIMVLIRRVTQHQLEDLRAKWRNGTRVLDFPPAE
ncbi:hypothetical protein LTR78_005066 [Recurvomyces mirabilis]|uniref:Uncharacterized protein n=1 Tax=Recurvomyces mirabilis TaxID=574656 RepID=A0AAE1C1X2_9PEZI|nr:hypothetical protein LTR78_005066 [Recurvomyces mirabilis]KAK5158318.1 hypothetical protein LTS14_003336 [Recurvomyces mirabilis]